MITYQPGDMPVPDYKVDSVLGVFDDGRVYKVVNVKTDILKALKVIRLQGFNKYNALPLFREIRHTNLVPIDHYWLKDGQGQEIKCGDDEPLNIAQSGAVELLILQGLADCSLVDLLEIFLEKTGKGIPVDDLMDYMHQVAKAIDFLNTPKTIGSRQNVTILHGDIKPGNILIVSGTVIQLGDCGLAKALSFAPESKESEETGYVESTPEYAAPEQLGGRASRNSDQYALAISYYEMRTGKLPFDDRKNRYACLAVNGFDFSLVPLAEQEVLHKASHRQHDQRYHSCLEFYIALKKAHEQVGSDLDTTGERSGKSITQDAIHKLATQTLLIERLKPGAEDFLAGYQLISRLGHGSNEEIWQLKAINDNKNFLLKILHTVYHDKTFDDYTFHNELYNLTEKNGILNIERLWVVNRFGVEIPADQIETPAALRNRLVMVLLESVERTLEDYVLAKKRGTRQDHLKQHWYQIIAQLCWGASFWNSHCCKAWPYLNPASLLVDKFGQIKIDCAGIARYLRDDRNSDRSLADSYAFVAPEASDYKYCDQSDQYCLAMIFYWLCVGETIFPRHFKPDDIKKYLQDNYLDFSDKLPDEAGVLTRATMLDPTKRFPDSSKFLTALKNVINYRDTSLPQPDQTIDEKKESPAEPATTPLESSPSRTEDIKQPATNQVGPYKLLQLLGEGGMGSVWDAEQMEPVRRRVALKLIKVGMASKIVLARFEAERQAMALMDHPHIAKILDAGTTEQGQPYFVMEQVKGLPITKYCDEAKLTLRQRLELFIPVCHAIQHAHEKGIIHRDLKPSNILVGLYDGQPVPKVIDFGVAKALHQPLTERTLYTEMGMILGTPEYMAPEQAEINALAIDARADIYSLGVILYELFTSSTPFDKRLLQQGALFEMLRMIREVEPPTPSQKLTSLDTLADAAKNRRTEPHQLSRLIKGDLDWIAMKCLEKERDRRYDKANSLALDIGRYLKEEVVLARPPSRSYRFKKWVRRHRASVVAGSLVFLSLLGAIAGISWGLIHADSSRQVLEPTKPGSTNPVSVRDVEEEIESKLKNGEVAHTAGVRIYPSNLKVGDRVDVIATSLATENNPNKTRIVLENVEVLHIEKTALHSDNVIGRICLRLTRQQSLVMKNVEDTHETIGMRFVSQTSIDPKK